MITSPWGASGPVRVNYGVCFSDSKGQPKSSVERRQTKLLAGVTPLLQTIVEPDEEVLYVAESVTPYSLLEFLMTGWIVTLVKRCLLVVTNRRLLHLPATPSLRPRGSVSEIRFGDVERLEITGLVGKKLVVGHRNGKQESFPLPRREAAAKLQVLLSQIDRGMSPSPEPGRHFLCPRCARRLQAGAEQCSACSQGFKTRKRAVFWSLLAPGGGYFYTGHVVLGLMDAGVEAVLLLLVILGIVMGVSGEPDAWVSVLVGGGILAVEKLVTIYHASHYVAEFLPASR